MTGITRAMAARIIAGYFGTQATYVGGQYDAYSIRDSEDRQWKIVSDSSIRPESGRDTRPNQNYRVEFVSPICVYSDIETIQEIIRSLRAGKTVTEPKKRKPKPQAEMEPTDNDSAGDIS